MTTGLILMIKDPVLVPLHTLQNSTQLGRESFLLAHSQAPTLEFEVQNQSLLNCHYSNHSKTPHL